MLFDSKRFTEPLESGKSPETLLGSAIPRHNPPPFENADLKGAPRDQMHSEYIADHGFASVSPHPDRQLYYACDYG
jgi:hypothetical protein